MPIRKRDLLKCLLGIHGTTKIVGYAFDNKSLPIIECEICKKKVVDY